jgi:hypothetical protein
MHSGDYLYLCYLCKVLETGDDLGEVTETVDYYVQGATIAAGNLFGRYANAYFYIEDCLEGFLSCEKAKHQGSASLLFHENLSQNL